MLTQSPPAQIGSLEIFWPLIEPILDALSPRRVCEIGVAAGALTERLLAWTDRHDGAYVGIDPAPDGNVRARFSSDPEVSTRQLLLTTSLAALPDVDGCGVYFLDGDHNYFTVLNELQHIAAATLSTDQLPRAPIVFMHDVSWPWGRRDMYYLPITVPPDARQPSSESLGVALDHDELIEGGLREPGRYAIALQAGGPRNGVLTAAEDFLAGEAGAGWEKIVLPVAYGLAVLYRPGDPALPEACRERLLDLRKMAATGGAFLQACEENFLGLYLYAEYHRITASTAHHATLGAYAELERAYHDLLAHSDSLLAEYKNLAATHGRLRGPADADVGPSQPPPGNQFE